MEMALEAARRSAERRRSPGGVGGRRLGGMKLLGEAKWRSMAAGDFPVGLRVMQLVQPGQQLLHPRGTSRAARARVDRRMVSEGPRLNFKFSRRTGVQCISSATMGLYERLRQRSQREMQEQLREVAAMEAELVQLERLGLHRSSLTSSFLAFSSRRTGARPLY
jgi:hypothetical protein